MLKAIEEMMSRKQIKENGALNAAKVTEPDMIPAETKTYKSPDILDQAFP